MITRPRWFTLTFMAVSLLIAAIGLSVGTVSFKAELNAWQASETSIYIEPRNPWELALVGIRPALIGWQIITVFVILFTMTTGRWINKKKCGVLFVCGCLSFAQELLLLLPVAAQVSPSSKTYLVVFAANIVIWVSWYLIPLMETEVKDE